MERDSVEKNYTSYQHYYLYSYVVRHCGSCLYYFFEKTFVCIMICCPMTCDSFCLNEET